MIFSNSNRNCNRKALACIVILSVVIFVLLRLPFTYVSINEENYRSLFDQKRVLFVIAHPDDEVMFFGPTINSLRRRIGAENIYLLAITNGNYEGKGKTREKELVLSFKELKLNIDHIYFHKRENPLEDNPDKHLPFQEIASGIERYIKYLNIQLIVTFDDLGVSGHINHGDIYRALNCCLTLQKETQVLVLKSVNYLRKHSSIFDAPVTFLLDGLYNGDLVFLSGPDDVQRTKTSLYVHKSQYTTFHNILHHFSDRFIYLNTLKKIDIHRTKSLYTKSQTAGFKSF